MALAHSTFFLEQFLVFTSLGALLGFTPMPVAFLLFILVATSIYLILVEVVKRKLMRRLSR
jgi:hypothetical protein